MQRDDASFYCHRYSASNYFYFLSRAFRPGPSLAQFPLLSQNSPQMGIATIDPIVLTKALLEIIMMNSILPMLVMMYWGT